RAVDRVCRILELLQDSPAGVTLTHVVAHTDLPKTSAFRYLWTLEQHNFVVRSHTGTYTLGTGITRMNVPTLDVLVQRSKSWIDELRDELSETVSLGVLEGNEVTYLYIAESSRSVRLAARLGEREPLHATALGKVMAAPLGEQQ